MAFEKGNDIRVSIGEILIGGQQGCSINRETETAESLISFPFSNAMF